MRRNKTAFIGVRLLPEERQTLCELGAGEHLNVSETIRLLIREVGRKQGVWPPAVRGTVEGQGVRHDGNG